MSFVTRATLLFVLGHIAFVAVAMLFAAGSLVTTPIEPAAASLRLRRGRTVLRP